MPFVSVTRLRARNLWNLPTVLVHTLRARRQLKPAQGFIGGYLATGPRYAFWTVTVWMDEAAMRAYRDAGAHRTAMPKLLDACDEASVAHWQSDEGQIPEPREAAARMRTGRASKVRHPSPAHAAGNALRQVETPRKGPRL